MDDLIVARAQKAIKDRVFPGCVVGYVKDGKRGVLPFGHLTYENDARKVVPETIYDVASITKAIPTASLLLKFIDEGRASLDDRVIDHLPAFGGSKGKEDVMLRHLLTYTLDIDVPHLSDLKDRMPEEIIEVVLTAPLKSPPGTTFHYTNSTAALTGFVAEKIGGKKLPELAHHNFFGPLGMHRTTFWPRQFGIENIAPTEIDAWRGREVRGEVHDESAYVMSREMSVGSAGLFSTVPDLLNFLEMLLGGGVRDGKKYFSEAMVREMYRNQIADTGESVGLGWELNQPWFMGEDDPEDTFGKTGFTGCVVMVNVPLRAAFAILSNRTYPHRPADSSAINKFRTDIAEIVL